MKKCYMSYNTRTCLCIIIHGVCRQYFADTKRKENNKKILREKTKIRTEMRQFFERQ